MSGVIGRMKPIARLTDLHQCPIHGLNPITSVVSRSQCEGLAIATVGDMTACGAVITTGSPECIIDGRPTAHIGSRTSHGGVIVSGTTSQRV